MWEVLERLSLKDGLLLWEALGEDPRDFPLGKAEALKKAKQRIRGDRMSPGITRNEGTKCPAPLRAEERRPLAKKEKRGDRVSPGKRGNQGTERPRYPDPAGALAQELGGWRAGLLFRARKEQNGLIQKLAHQHRDSLLELLNLAEGLPLPRRIPTALAYVEYGGSVYLEAQRQAQAARRGVWQGSFQAPWEYRRNPANPPTAGTPRPSSPPTPAPSGAYYRNCAEARAAGAAPIYRGQPGYRKGLDRDGDGVACER